MLINNASAQYMVKDFADTDLDKTEDIFRSNIIQMMAITKFALPHLNRGDSLVALTECVLHRKLTVIPALSIPLP